MRVGGPEGAEGIGCVCGGGACPSVCPAACPLPRDPPPLLPACFTGGGGGCKSVELLISLNVPSMPSMHWHDNAGWEVCIALAGGRVRCLYMYIET